MTKHQDAPNSFETLFSGGGLEDAGARSRAFWDARADAIAHAQSCFEGWWARRQAAAAAASQLWARVLASPSDPAAAAEAWSAWTAGEVERLGEDAKCGGELAARLAADAVSALSAGAGTAAPKARRRSVHKPAKSNGATARSAAHDVR